MTQDRSADRFVVRRSLAEKKRRILLLLILLLVSSGEICRYPRTHSLNVALRYLKDKPRTASKCSKKKRKKRQQLDWTEINLDEDTGLYGDEFEELLEQIRPLIEKDGRNTASILTTRERLYLGLHYLKHRPSLKEYRKILGISRSTAWDQIQFVMPKLYTVLTSDPRRIQMPDSWKTSDNNISFDGKVVNAAIDCTSHTRTRVHPGQAFWYRGDKKAFFVTSQVMCSIDGSKIFSVHLGMGHNNDQAMFNRTVKTLVESEDLHLLADLGYKHPALIRPHKSAPEEWRKEQSALRSVVEVVCGYAHQWAVASRKFRGSPEFQQLCLMCVYELVNRRLQQFPLGVRHSSMLK